MGRPHAVGPDALVLRFLNSASVTVPLAAVAGVRLAHRSGVRGVVAVGPDDVAVPVNGFTTVEVALHPGSVVRVDRRGAVPAARVFFDADDPAAAVAAVRAAAPRPAAPPG